MRPFVIIAVQGDEKSMETGEIHTMIALNRLKSAMGQESQENAVMCISDFTRTPQEARQAFLHQPHRFCVQVSLKGKRYCCLQTGVQAMLFHSPEVLLQVYHVRGVSSS